MGQIPFTSLILTFLRELIGIFKLTPTKTCETLYERYEQYHEKRAVVVLYDPQHKFSYYAENIKAFQLSG
jgi:hypothetical protein